MSFRSLASLRYAAFSAIVLAVSACSDDRQAQLSGLEVVDVPAVETGPQQNQNIANPTLVIPDTFPVAEGDELTLVFSEEFDGPNIDPEVWFFETGDGAQYGLLDNGSGAWGNNELQWYLPDNAMIVNGVLEITARRETASYQNYTSARINTRDRFAFKYGRIEASMKLPSGQGLWPAFWMLSQDSDYLCSGEPCIWAATGEIDIVEAVNLDGTGGNEIFGTIHYGDEFPANQLTDTRYTPGVDVTESFNTYAVEWDEDEIRWYFNGELYATQTSNTWFSTADNAGPNAPFDQNFHILLNLAVGGNFPGSPNGTTPFPATMEVDWVRVYSGEDPSGDVATEPSVSAPTPTEDPADVVSIYSDAYTDIAGVNFNPDWGQATVFTEAQIAGNRMLKYANLDFQGIDFAGNPQDVSEKEYLHLDVWTADSTALNVYLISPGAETPDAIPVAPNSWVSVDIPLTVFAGVDLTNVIQLKFDGNGTIFVDNLYFGGNIPKPEVGAPTPTQDPADVISLFSDAYTNVAATWPTVWSEVTSVNDVTIDGGLVKQHLDVNFVGVEFLSLDASGMTHLHVDVWTPDVGSLLLRLVDFGGDGFEGAAADTSGALTFDSPTQGEWVSLDIPLADFQAEGLASTADLNQLVIDPTPDGTIVYADNVYFYNADAGVGPGAGPTAGIFSEGDTDSAIALGAFVNSIDFGGNNTVATPLAASSLSNGVTAFEGTDVLEIDYQNTGGAFGGALINLQGADISSYTALKFSINTSQIPGFADLTIQIEPPGGPQPGNNVALSAYTPVSTSGDWSTFEIPLADFSGADLTGVNVIGFWNARDGGGALVFGQLYLDDIQLTTAGGDTGGGTEGNIAINGGFETGQFNDGTENASWQQFPGGGIQTIVTTNPSEGTYAANLNVPARGVGDPGVDNLIKNANLEAGNLTPNAPITITWDMRGSLQGAGGVVFVELFSEVSGGGTSKAEIYTGGPIFPDDPDVWTSYTWTTTLGADVSGGVTLQLKVSCGAVEGCGADIYFDNVTIVTGDGGGDTGGGDGGGATVGIFSETNNDTEIALGAYVNSADFGGNNTVATPLAASTLTNGVTAFEGTDVLEVDYQNTGGAFGGALINLQGADISSYTALKFSINTTQIPGFADLTIQIEPPGGPQPGNNVALSSYAPVSTSGDWSTYEIPLADFSGADLTGVNVIGYWNARDAGGTLVFGQLYLDDIHLTTAGDTGGGDTGGGTEGNIAINGGFETGLFNDGTDNASWQQFAGGGIQTIVTTNPSEGTYAANLNVPVRGVGDPGVDNLIKNANLEAGNLTPNAPITITWDMRGSLQGAGGVVFVELFSEVSGGGTSKAEIYTGGPIFPDDPDVWTSYTWTTTLGADVSGGVTLQLKVSCGAVEGCGADIYIDNVTIVVDGGGDTGGGDGTVLVTFDEVPPPTVSTFLGAVATIEAGPAGGGSGNTLNILRDGGGDRAGATVFFPNGLVSGPGTQTISAEFYAPAAGIPVVAVLAYGGGGTADVLQNETVELGWQDLTWTFSDLDDADYDRMAFVPNEGTVDTGANYYVDNITLAGGGGDTGGGSVAGNIAINGGFETGQFNDGTDNASWQTFPNGGIQTIVTTNPSEGTYAANLNVPVRSQTDGAVDNLLKNANLEAGNLTPGAPVTVTWDMRGSLEGAGGVVFVELFSELSGGGTSKAEIYTGGPIFPDDPDVWTSYTWNTTLGPDVSGGVTLQLKVSCGPVEGCGADIYFDNVTIVVN